MFVGMQLVFNPLINFRSNNHKLYSHCCHGNKNKIPRFLRFCLIMNMPKLQNNKNNMNNHGFFYNRFYSKNRSFDSELYFK